MMKSWLGLHGLMYEGYCKFYSKDGPGPAVIISKSQLSFQNLWLEFLNNSLNKNVVSSRVMFAKYNSVMFQDAK